MFQHSYPTLLAALLLAAAPGVHAAGGTDSNLNVTLGSGAGASLDTDGSGDDASLNTITGAFAGTNTTVGDRNTFIGRSAGANNIDGSRNTYVGLAAGFNATGSGNVFLGNFAGYNETGSDRLYIENSDATDPLLYGEFDNDLVGINGILGVGTQLPATPLHVRRSDGTAKVLVQETNSTAQVRELFELRNNGGPFFIFKNLDIAQSYAFAMLGGRFIVNHQQADGIELELDSAGNATLKGTLTENSSRAVKTRVEAVEPAAVLDKLAELELLEWSYKQNDRARHLSPMAEDFYRLFGLGSDNKHIAPKDMAGVAMAAAQQLYERNQQLSERNEQLRADTEALKAKMAEQKAELQSMRRQQTAEKTALKAELAELRDLVEALAAEDQYAMAEAQ